MINDDWRRRRPDGTPPAPRDRKREMMRRAKTAAENRYSIGGQLKRRDKMPRPVTLPKMPWDQQEGR